MAERLASYLPETTQPHIIELGCGTGLFTRHHLTLPIKNLTLNDIVENKPKPDKINQDNIDTNWDGLFSLFNELD